MDTQIPEIIAGNEGKKEILDSAILNSISNGGPSLVAVIRMPDMKVLFANDTFKYYLGYSVNETADPIFHFTDVLVNDQTARLLYQFSFVKKDMASRSRFVIYQLKNKNGEIAPFYLYAAPIPSDDPDEQLYHLVMHPDLSKWKMPFTSFNTHELFLEQFNSEDFGTFEWLISTDKIFWSVGIYHIFEVDENFHDLKMDFGFSFVHPSDKQRVSIAVKDCFDKGSELRVEFRIITALKKIKTINCLGKVIKDIDGNQVKLAGSLRDVTGQRLIENSLKNKVEELNHTNKELEEFAYIASHDMQEPLRKITTFSDRLHDKYKDVLTGDGAMYLARMTASAENMRNLINDLLDFSRVSKNTLPYERVDLNVILQQVKTDLELIIEETGTVITSGELPVIDAIPSQMKQLLTNIINNAIKFHKEGVTPIVNVVAEAANDKTDRKENLPKDIDYCRIEITDNGIGFEDEYATRIFQVFQRLHGKSEYPGSGIGLAICKKIVEYHQGLIYAENIEGTGARFVFLLPLQLHNTKEQHS